MTKRIIKLVLLLFSVTVSMTMVCAETKQSKSPETEVEIQMKGGDKEINPSIYQPNENPDVSQLLPKTNEMLQTLLVLMLGVAILILVLGLIMFKKVYSNKEYTFIS